MRAATPAVRARGTAAAPRPPAPAPASGQEPWIALGLVVLTLVAFWKVRACGFVNFDDDLYVTDNPMVQRGITAQGIGWAFTTLHSFNWHPLTWLSHMLDCQLFGVNAAMHHTTSLVLHVANTVLLLHVFVRMTGALWRSALVAALFALHPLHVESVAWIAERKDVLSGLFWLLTMWAYVEYARRGGRLAYALSVACFALGVLAKPMVITLPFALLLMDVWPLRRLRGVGRASGETAVASTAAAAPASARPREARKAVHPRGGAQRSWSALVLEKLPFLALSGVSAIMTFIAQHHGGAVASLTRVPAGTRIANAFVAYVGYLGKLAWPARLCILYPIHPHVPAVAALMSVLFLAAVTFGVVTQWRARPFLGVGWFWYLGTLVPVIGLVQVGSQAMADRYMYLPSIGVSLMLVWGVAEVVGRAKVPAAVTAGVAAVLLLVLAWRTHDQVRYWTDSVAMYERALSVTTDNPMMEKNYGVTLMRLERLDEAKRHLDAAIREDPMSADAFYNRAVLDENRHDPASALPDYQQAIRLKPDYRDAHDRLGVLLFNQGRMAEAAQELAATVRLDPSNAQSRSNYGSALALLGRYPEAIEQYREALRIKPDLVPAQEGLRRAEAALGTRSATR